MAWGKIRQDLLFHSFMLSGWSKQIIKTSSYDTRPHTPSWDHIACFSVSHNKNKMPINSTICVVGKCPMGKLLNSLINWMFVQLPIFDSLMRKFGIRKQYIWQFVRKWYPKAKRNNALCKKKQYTCSTHQVKSEKSNVLIQLKIDQIKILLYLMFVIVLTMLMSKVIIHTHSSSITLKNYSSSKLHFIEKLYGLGYLKRATNIGFFFVFF